MKKWKSSWSFLLVLTVISLSSCIRTSLSSILDPHSKGFITCVQSFPNHETSITFTPANSSFLPIWLFSARNLRFVNNYTRKPSIIVTPFNAAQVQIALYCTKQQGYEIRIRSGGHHYEGVSYTAQVPFVMLDFYNMKSINIDVPNQTAWVETGAVLGELYYAISQKTDTLSFPGAVCPTVAIGGFIGGGGYGNLLRKYGLGADNVLDVRFMNIDGSILDRKSMGEDLFWAIRGGGASSFGIVLAWKLRLVPVPERVTIFTLRRTLEENAKALFYKYQYVAPFIDRNLLLRVQVSAINVSTPQKTVQVMFEGIYQGRKDTLVPLLDEKFPELGVTREMCDEVRTVQSYLPFTKYDFRTPVAILANRSAFAKRAYKGKSDYARAPIPIEGIERIIEKFMENDGSGGLIINPFGGRMGEISETAIPYPHRAGVLFQIYQNTGLMDSNSILINLRRKRWLNELHDVFKPYVSKCPREAYSNYVDLDLGFGNRTYEEASEWGESYWKKDNFKRLIQIKARVDPQNFFRHPQSIPSL